jgi:GcrA cell cycle regulator
LYISTYTDAELDQIRQMANAGQSANQIAKVIGRSRSAIVSIIHRRLSKEGVRLKGFSPRPHTSTAERPKNRVQYPAERRAPRPKMRTGIPVPDALLIQLEDLRNDQCRWPIGDVGEPGFGFCGHAKFRGSYCEAHAARAVFECRGAA